MYSTPRTSGGTSSVMDLVFGRLCEPTPIPPFQRSPRGHEVVGTWTAGGGNVRPAGAGPCRNGVTGGGRFGFTVGNPAAGVRPGEGWWLRSGAGRGRDLRGGCDPHHNCPAVRSGNGNGVCRPRSGPGRSLAPDTRFPGPTVTAGGRRLLLARARVQRARRASASRSRISIRPRVIRRMPAS